MAEENLEARMNDKESKGFMRKSFDLGFGIAAAIGTTVLSVSTVGPLGILVGGAFAGGGMIGSLINKQKSLYEIVKDAVLTYASVNAIIYPLVLLGDATFPLISNIDITGKIARSLYAMTVYNAAFIVNFRTAQHFIDNKLNPKGLWHSISDDFWPFFRRIGIGFAVGYSLVANGITELALGSYKVPIFAANALPLGIYNGMNPPGEKKEAPSKQYAPQPQAAYQPT